jgi:hypothetical protein
MELEKVITLLSLIAVLLIIYKMILSNETFDQIDICDYDSPDPSNFCKSIKKGCTHLKHEQENLNNTINNNCTNLPTNTRELINVAINCDDNVNKLVMNKYVQKEVCSQIKNFPDTLPSEEKLTPSTYTDFPSVMENNDYYINGNNGFADF